MIWLTDDGVMIDFVSSVSKDCLPFEPQARQTFF